MDRLLHTPIVTALLASSTVKAMLDTYTIGSTTYYPVIYGRSIPAEFQDMNRLIQIYRVTSIGASQLNEVTYTVNCRQATEPLSEQLAEIVYGVLNRIFATYDSTTTYMRCNVGSSIMETETDWNCPVDVQISTEL